MTSLTSLLERVRAASGPDRDLDADHERIALSAAIKVMDEKGMDFRGPWECDLDDLERERFEALRDACRAYFSALTAMQKD